MNTAPPMVLTTPRLLVDWLVSLPDIEGITLSGGDPFDQPLEALAEFLETFRRESSLSVLAYTGRLLSQLQGSGDRHIARCLRSIDVLIDGPYVEEQNVGVGWRGSTNQRVHQLGPRPAGAEMVTTAARRLELRVSANGVVSLTGLPARGRGAGLAERLATVASGPVIHMSGPGVGSS
jgi:anaerobic ribonucleoside-triphosphate reductase activating protein